MPRHVLFYWFGFVFFLLPILLMKKKKKKIRWKYNGASFDPLAVIWVKSPKAWGGRGVPVSVCLTALL